MGTKNNPGKFDCYANALPDEPMFTLLARDLSAPALVRAWAAEREKAIHKGERPQADIRMVGEAKDCAANMETWRKANDGIWRKPPESTEPRAVLAEVWEWISNWGPEFVHDDEWPAVARRVRAALESANAR